MKKLLATLVASMFAVSTAFGAAHVGAPMPGASAAKKEEKAAAKTDKKADKAVAKTDKKAADKKATAKKAAPKKDEKKS